MIITVSTVRKLCFIDIKVNYRCFYRQGSKTWLLLSRGLVADRLSLAMMLERVSVNAEAELRYLARERVKSVLTSIVVVNVC